MAVSNSAAVELRDSVTTCPSTFVALALQKRRLVAGLLPPIALFPQGCLVLLLWVLSRFHLETGSLTVIVSAKNAVQEDTKQWALILPWLST